MSRQTNYVLGLLLLIATLAVATGIATYAFPRLLASPQTDTERLAAVTNDVAAQVSQIEPVVTNASDSIPTATSTTSPTPRPTTPPPATLEAIPTSAPTTVPTVTQAPTATAEPVEEIDSTDLDLVLSPLVTSLRTQAWLFSVQDEEAGWTGYYFEEAESVTVTGRSEDEQWLQVTHPLGQVGWIMATAVSAESDAINQLQVSTYEGSPSPVNALQLQPSATAVLLNQPAPTSTPQQVAVVNTSVPTRTPQPTWTPRPTNTPLPSGKWPTSTPAAQAVVPTSTPWPTNTPWPTRTPQPVAQVNPTATPWPTATSRPQPTAVPTQAPDAGAANEAPATQDELIYESNAIAWWQQENGSVTANGNGTWRGTILVRVPTSFQYTFDLARLSQTQVRQTNLQGDDVYALTVNGIGCGQGFSAELVARQNGARMQVLHEFTISDGPISLQAPC